MAETGTGGYREVIEWVQNQIASGAFREGDRMPTEKALAEQFGLSRQTIRHATGTLVEQKVLTRIQGSGTYVGCIGKPRRTKRTMRIAVISTFYESYIFPPILKGIERALSDAGYAMQVSFTDNQVARERQILEQILSGDEVDGLLVEPSQSALPNPNLALYQKIADRRIPILFFHASYPDLPFPCVRMDDISMGREAVRILKEAGHTRIGGIFKSDDRQGKLRYQGFLQAMAEVGFSTGGEEIVWIDTPETKDLSPIGAYVLERWKNVTAAVCYNDEVAIQLVDIAERQGILIPEDLSLVGMDDANLAPVCRVPLTTLRHPKEALGRKAAENLLQMIENAAFDGNYLFPAEPVLRASVGKPGK